MADPKNQGQFGNRADTAAQASKGGKSSGGNFANNTQRASAAGKKGAASQPVEAKRRGGENSHRTSDMAS